MNTTPEFITKDKWAKNVFKKKIEVTQGEGEKVTYDARYVPT